MIKNLKLCFFFLLSPLFLLPSLFFLSPSQSAFTTSSSSEVDRTYPADKWNAKQRGSVLNSLSDKNSRADAWLKIVVFGLKKLAFKSDGQNVVFHFDKLATAFQEQIFKQRVLPTGNTRFDYTQIQGEAQKQLLQPFETGTETFVDGFLTILSPMLEKYGDLFLNSIRPSILKMQTLGLFQVAVSYESQYEIQAFVDKENLNSVLYKDLKSGKAVLQEFAFLTFSPIPNFAKTVLDRAINKVWTPWLKVLQKASGFGLVHLTVGKEEVDVFSLVLSKSQEVSALTLANLKILKKLQPLGLPKLQTQVQTWIDSQLDLYKPTIQSTLANFANSKITQIKINGIFYQVNLLLKNTNLQLIASRLSQDAKNQLLALLKAKITSQVLEDALLEVYFSTIKDNLNALREQNITQVTIPNGKTYSLTELSKPVNKNKTVAFLTATAKVELAVLAKNVITRIQLNTALITILKTRAAEATVLQTQKNKNQKKLIIGLSVAVGTLTLSALGSFLYWFFKIKK